MNEEKNINEVEEEELITGDILNEDSVETEEEVEEQSNGSLASLAIGTAIASAAVGFVGFTIKHFVKAYRETKRKRAENEDEQENEQEDEEPIRLTAKGRIRMLKRAITGKLDYYEAKPEIFKVNEDGEVTLIRQEEN